ncbi:unnamed protein product, partial [Ectocarpus sp. 4 AP-2014]
LFDPRGAGARGGPEEACKHRSRGHEIPRGGGAVHARDQGAGGAPQAGALGRPGQQRVAQRRRRIGRGGGGGGGWRDGRGQEQGCREGDGADPPLQPVVRAPQVGEPRQRQGGRSAGAGLRPAPHQGLLPQGGRTQAGGAFPRGPGRPEVHPEARASPAEGGGCEQGHPRRAEDGQRMRAEGASEGVREGPSGHGQGSQGCHIGVRAEGGEGEVGRLAQQGRPETGEAAGQRREKLVARRLGAGGRRYAPATPEGPARRGRGPGMDVGGGGGLLGHGRRDLPAPEVGGAYPEGAGGVGGGGQYRPRPRGVC